MTGSGAGEHPTAVENVDGAGGVVGLRSGKRFTVNRVHQRTGNARVVQTQGVADLMRRDLIDVDGRWVSVDRADRPVLRQIEVSVTRRGGTVGRGEVSVGESASTAVDVVPAESNIAGRSAGVERQARIGHQIEHQSSSAQRGVDRCRPSAKRRR